MNESDLESARRFLREIWPRRTEEERFEIRVLSGEKAVSRSFTDVGNAARFALLQEGNVFFGVGLRRGAGRGTKDVTRVGALWADLDARDGDVEARIAALAGCKLPPSIIVLSGGGVHGYWLLREPVTDTARASKVMKVIAGTVGGDKVHDPARILRVPGTLNHKYTPAVPVRIAEADYDRRFYLQEIEEAFPYRQEELTSSWENHPGLLSTSDILSGVPEGGRDNAIFQLIITLHKSGVPRDYAFALAKKAALSCNPPYPVDTVMEKVQRVYMHPLVGHGIAFNAPSLNAMVEINTADLDAQEQGELVYLPLLDEPGYFVLGWSHLLAGYPRSGKTELLAWVCSEWARAGRSVLYITEESADIWSRRVQSRRLSLAKFRVVFGLGHPSQALFARAFSGDEEIVIIDTLRNLLDLKDETDNSRLAEALNPWVAGARAHEKTLIIAHHTRKGGGANGEGIAGGHGLLGMFDIALELLRDNSKENRRLVRAYARLVTPPDFMYALEGGKFKPLGAASQFSAIGLIDDVLAILAGSGVWMTTQQIAKQLVPPPAEATLRRTLQQLAEEGTIERIPPISTGNVQGTTPYWHSGQDNSTARN